MQNIVDRRKPVVTPWGAFVRVIGALKAIRGAERAIMCLGSHTHTSSYPIREQISLVNYCRKANLMPFSSATSSDSFNSQQ